MAWSDKLQLPCCWEKWQGNFERYNNEERWMCFNSSSYSTFHTTYVLIRTRFSLRPMHRNWKTSDEIHILYFPRYPKFWGEKEMESVEYDVQWCHCYQGLTRDSLSRQFPHLNHYKGDEGTIKRHDMKVASLLESRRGCLFIYRDFPFVQPWIKNWKKNAALSHSGK